MKCPGCNMQERQGWTDHRGRTCCTVCKMYWGDKDADDLKPSNRGREPLTMQQIDDRMEAWRQAIESLGEAWCDTPSEREQGQALQQILQRQADNWYRRIMNRRESP